jgi:hypothetical protein
MVNPERIKDRREIAERTLQTVKPRDRPLLLTCAVRTFGSLSSRTTAPSNVFELRLTTTDLRVATAALDTLTLSFEAAAVVVAYLSSDESEASDPNFDGVIAEQLLAEISMRDLLTFTALDFEVGSIFARFSINPRTTDGRRRLAAIIGLGVTIAAAFLPAVAIVEAAVVVVQAGRELNDILTPDGQILLVTSVDLETANDAIGSVEAASDATRPAAAPASTTALGAGFVSRAEFDEVLHRIAELRALLVKEEASRPVAADDSVQDGADLSPTQA